MKQKRKTSAKSKSLSGGKSKPSRKHKNYSSEYLAIILAIILILESALFNISTASDWKNAVSILDVSSGVTQVSENLVATFQPMIDTAENVNEFYQLAATQMMQLLDFSQSGFGTEVGFVYEGVANFYQQASNQMVQLLGGPSFASLPTKLAGRSVGN